MMLKPGAAAVPVPVTCTKWGLPLAESEIVTVALRVPFADGVKITLKLKLLLPAVGGTFTGPGKAGVIANSPAFEL